MEYFSEGQKKKVLIAGSLCQKAHIYVWDEPLNFIDIFSRIQIEEMILNSKPTMLVVEHDFFFCPGNSNKDYQAVKLLKIPCVFVYKMVEYALLV